MLNVLLLILKYIGLIIAISVEVIIVILAIYIIYVFIEAIIKKIREQ